MDGSSDTIAAIATAPGTGALAVVRLTGPKAAEIADRIFRSLPGRRGVLSSSESHRCHVGWIEDPDSGGPVDQVVVSVFRAGRSYTGEDLVEISCHGGAYVAGRILDLLLRVGARPAAPGEFTKRAFLNGRIDLAQAEAVAALIAARSQREAEAAAAVLSGKLGEEVSQAMDRIVRAKALLEASLDVQEDGAPDVLSPVGSEQERRRLLLEEIGQAQRRLEQLAEAANATERLGRGLRVVLVGAPNAGKSSIYNALLARDRAMVSPEPGTTRDYLEAWLEWQGLPVILTDTAGLTEQASSEVEQAAMERSRALLSEAALCILVVDASQFGDLGPVAFREIIASEARRLLAATGIDGCKCLVALHKADLLPSSSYYGLGPVEVTSGVEGVFSSVVGPPGISALAEKARVSIEEVWQEWHGGARGKVVPGLGGRQRSQLEAALEALRRAMGALDAGEGEEVAAFELDEALGPLGSVLGRDVGEQVLDEIFARFCVGK